MTKKQKSKVVTEYLLNEGKEAAIEALKDGVSEEEQEYYKVCSFIISNLYKKHIK